VANFVFLAKNGFYDAPTVVCVFCQNNFLFWATIYSNLPLLIFHADGEGEGAEPIGRKIFFV